MTKTGESAMAPVLWQDGKIGELINYCLDDVFATKKLVDSVLFQAGLWSPEDDGQWLTILPPGYSNSSGHTCDNCGHCFNGTRCPNCGACSS